MADQGNLIIGRNITSIEEARQVYAMLGVPITAKDLNALDRHPPEITKTIIHKGEKFKIPVEFRLSEYGGAVLGIWLTSRYQGAILDAKSPHGLEQPAEFELSDIGKIMDQIQIWWPTAKLVLWTEQY